MNLLPFFARLRTARPLAVGLLASALIAASPARAADLTVLIDNLRSAQGTVMLALFDSEGRFLKPDGATSDQRIAADRSPVAATFRGVNPGRYAISAFHDENGNGKLDKNLLGIPTERYGFSNDAFGTVSAPSFDKAAFDVGADLTVKINLR